MSRVLMLQKMSSNNPASEFGDMFVSAVSIMCPVGPVGADSSYQME